MKWRITKQLHSAYFTTMRSSSSSSSSCRFTFWETSQLSCILFQKYGSNLLPLRACGNQALKSSKQRYMYLKFSLAFFSNYVISMTSSAAFLALLSTSTKNWSRMSKINSSVCCSILFRLLKLLSESNCFRSERTILYYKVKCEFTSKFVVCTNNLKNAIKESSCNFYGSGGTCTGKCKYS